MGWMMGVPGFDSRRGLGIFLFTTASTTALGPTQPPITWVPRALFLGVKRPGREADHSPHLVPRSNSDWSYNSTPQYAFMAWCSVKKAQGQLYLLPLYKHGRGMKLTTYLHRLPRLRISGRIPPISQYVFTVWCLIKQ
jgi:hypothetical protein